MLFVLQWPGRLTIKRTILPKTEKRIKADLIVLLKEATVVAIALDIWSSKRLRGYMGMTVHFVDKSYRLRSFLLGCPRFEGKHTAEEIFNLAATVVLEYGIEQKIHYVATDNGSNVVKAFGDW